MFFNVVAANTSAYYKREACLITIIKWVFLLLPSNIIEFKFGLRLLYEFLPPLSQGLFCSWLLSVLRFIQCGWERINHALYFVIKQTLCSHRYGLQADLVRDVRTVHREELRLKLSPTNIPRRWWIPLSLVEGSGKLHNINCDIDFFFFFFLRRKKANQGFEISLFTIWEISG